MSAMAEYLKRYQSGDSSGTKKLKKKKQKDIKPPKNDSRLRVMDDDVFVAVHTQAKEDQSEDEDEARIQEQLEDSARKVMKFRRAFVPLDEEPSTSVLDNEDDIAGDENKKHVSIQIKVEPGSDVEKDASPIRRRKRHDSDLSDNSPPRRRKRHDSDASPKRNNRRDEDNSPPRRHRHDSDPSPPRKTRTRHDSDASPVRQKSSPALAKPLSSKTNDDSDASPPRRRDRNSALDTRKPRVRRDSDLSPPRRSQQSKLSDTKENGEGRSKRKGTPDRRSTRQDDLSPKRKRIKEEVFSDQEEQNDRRMLDGQKAGLQSAKVVREEGQKQRELDRQRLEEMDPELTGRYAETIQRTKQYGKREKPEDKEKKAREAAKQAELKEKYEKWNKGVKQLAEREERLQEAARVAAEPLTRTKDDVAMNEHLKEVLYDDDPMASFVAKKRQKEDIAAGKEVFPTYQGSFPPNRYGIRPGYRWDGVDRGNGFEGKLAINTNKRNADEGEYYKNIQVYE